MNTSRSRASPSTPASQRSSSFRHADPHLVDALGAASPLDRDLVCGDLSHAFAENHADHLLERGFTREAGSLGMRARRRGSHQLQEAALRLAARRWAEQKILGEPERHVEEAAGRSVDQLDLDLTDRQTSAPRSNFADVECELEHRAAMAKPTRRSPHFGHDARCEGSACRRFLDRAPESLIGNRRDESRGPYFGRQRHLALVARDQAGTRDAACLDAEDAAASDATDTEHQPGLPEGQLRGVEVDAAEVSRRCTAHALLEKERISRECGTVRLLELELQLDLAGRTGRVGHRDAREVRVLQLGRARGTYDVSVEIWRSGVQCGASSPHRIPRRSSS
jgi:hypothetical protein